MSKKSYMSLLKEAIAEFDTSDTVDVKGPMLDPILSWDGDGELPTYKDAASILERYYFNEKEDKGVRTLDEAEYEDDKGKASSASMKHTKGAGTEQAGTDEAGTIQASKSGKEKDIAKEWDEFDEQTGFIEENDLEMEDAILEKLIAEMEEEDIDEAEVMSYTGDGPKESMPKEKKAKGPEDDTEGAGTPQAGTGDSETQLPDRKDRHNTAVKPKKYTDENAQIEEALAALEMELLEQDKEEPEEGGEGEEELDVDKEMAKEAVSAVPGGPSPHKRGEDYEDDEAAYSEAFQIFKEAITEQDEEEEGGEEEEEEVKEWTDAINEDVENILENDSIDSEILDEALTDREKTFIFGKIQRMFGDCAKKCGRITIRSKANVCKDLCIAKRDQAIKAARAKVKAATAAAKGKEKKAAKFQKKTKDIENY